jgi:hypothetical protein
VQITACFVAAGTDIPAIPKTFMVATLTASTFITTKLYHLTFGAIIA